MSTYSIGFVSTRLAGTDGVSLETRKWLQVLRSLGHRCFFMAGESEYPEEVSYVVPEMHFKHEAIEEIQRKLFLNKIYRSPETTARIQELKEYLKRHIYSFIRTFDIQVLITENALSLPMNVPLGLALTEYIAETAQSTIGHHHDFYWERPRYLRSAARDYLNAAFPPALPSISHVVINSYAASQLAEKASVTSTLIPNVMDFDEPPPPLDAYAQDIRQELGLKPDEYFILQPTRIVPRKRIELAIELVRRLRLPAALVISHSAGDEGYEYEAYLRHYAEMLNVKVIFAYDRIQRERGTTPQGQKIYSLADVYQAADLVTYPSAIEGFGNAFLEAVYFKRPIVMNRYAIFLLDIEPKGFRVIAFDEFITDYTVEEARKALLHPVSVRDMVEQNFELGKKYFCMDILEHRLPALLHETMGISR